jgi:hypothetical protein
VSTPQFHNSSLPGAPRLIGLTTRYGLDTTIAADIQGPVIEALGTVEKLAWIGAGFPMGSVCVILLYGRFYSLFNSKWNLLFTVLLFEIGSAICGAAPSMDVLIVGRVIAGAGGSGIYLGCLVYITAMTIGKERGLYINLTGAAWGVGCVLGPIIGGAFAESSATWRWAFYINLPVSVPPIVAFIFILPTFHPVQGQSIIQRLKAIDYLGFVLGAGTWVGFLLALTMAGNMLPWSDGRNIALFVVFGVILASYILQQYFAVLTTPEQRLFPGHLLKSRTQVLLYIANAATAAAQHTTIYYTPIYFQFVNGDKPVQAAIRLLPFICVLITVSILAGTFLHIIKLYKLIFVIAGMGLIAGGGPLMVYLHPSSSAGLIYGLEIVVAFGMGFASQTGYTVATLTVKRAQDVGDALSLQNVSQIGAQAMALAIAGQIYQSTATRNLSSVLAGYGDYSHAEISSAVAGAQSELFQALSPGLKEQATVAITQAMQMAYVVTPVGGGVLLIAALCMKHERLFSA